MKNTEAQPPYETLEIGTPLDYTSDMYRVYFEVGDKKAFKAILLGFLGPERQNHIMALGYGFRLRLRSRNSDSMYARNCSSYCRS